MKVTHRPQLGWIHHSTFVLRLPVVGIQLGNIDELGEFEQILRILLEMRDPSNVTGIAVHHLHSLHRRPGGDRRELGDIAVRPAEQLDAETAWLLLDLKDTVLVEIVQVFVGDLPTRPSSPDASDQWSVARVIRW
jgi:hypothetical protein